MEFEAGLAHRTFAAQTFNAGWDLMDSRSDDLQMLAAVHASRWHWAHVVEASDRERSIGVWQCSRAYALLNEASMARRMAVACLAISRELPPFYLGYAHEAMARALGLGGDAPAAKAHLLAAENLLLLVEDPEERSILGDDLRGLMAQLNG